MGDDGGASGGHGGAAAATGGGGGGGAAHAGNGEVGAPHAPTDHNHGEKGGSHQNGDAATYVFPIANSTAPSRHMTTPNPFSRKNTGIDLDDYFVRETLRVCDLSCCVCY